MTHALERRGLAQNALNLPDNGVSFVLVSDLGRGAGSLASGFVQPKQRLDDLVHEELNAKIGHRSHHRRGQPVEESRPTFGANDDLNAPGRAQS